MFFPYLFPPKGTLTLTPGMGMGGGIHLEPQISKHLKNIIRTRIVHTSGSFFQKYLQNISIYTEKYTESDKRIKNNNFNTKYTKDSKTHFQRS